MAPRRGAIESPEPEEPSMSLVFNEALSWRAGKPIATETLLKRLKKLASELRDMDQEEVDKSSLTVVAKELAAQNLLNHKDNGVKAWTGCCLVDVLKLCAPDAPYTSSQVKNIFTFFVGTILPALSNPSHTYNTEHKYVLSSLTEVKSIVLMTDLPNAEDLMLHLFSTFFDICSGSSKSSTGEQVSKDVEYNMSQCLVTLVDEAPVVGPQVIDIIVAQFLRAATPIGGKNKHGAKADDKQSTLLLKDLPEAYNMAKTICNDCSDKMSRYVSQYFNDVMMEVSTSGGKANGNRKDDADSDDDDAPTGPSDADLKELNKAHRLLRELWRASPSVLQNVIPQVEAELSAENIQLRLLATETLGDIISGIGAAGPPPLPNMDPAAYPPVRLHDYPVMPITSILVKPSSPQSFSQTHPSVYHSFIGRKNDKSPVIRSAWTTAIGRILVTEAGGIGLNREDEIALVKSLAEKLNDPDEKVRIAAVKAVASFNLVDIMEKLVPNGPVIKSGSVLSNLADRARDRKPAVRAEAMTTLGTIWGVATGEIAAGNESVIASLGAIPSRIFEGFFANDLELNVVLDHVMFEQLLPLTYPPSKAKGSKNGFSQSQSSSDEPFDADRIRAERILLLVRSLDAKPKKAFFALQARQKPYFDVLSAYIKKCEEFNGGVTDGDAADVRQKLNAVIDYLLQFLPDPLRTSQDLHKYSKLHDRRTYQLLRYTMDPKSDFKTVHNAIKEFSKRIEAAPNVPAGLLDTFTPIIYRSAFLIYNRSHLPAILQFSRTDDKGLGATAQEVMNEISEKNPQVLTANIKELCKTLEDEAPTEEKENDPGTVATLKACAVFAKSKTESKSLPKDRKFTQTLVSYASYGTPPRAAKYAITLLMAATDRKEMHAKDLLEKSTKEWKYGERHFLTKLAAISQLQLLSPKIADDYSDEILEITTQELLLQVRTPAKETDPSWQNDDELDEECQAKCWALKILVNRLRTVEETEVKAVAQPVFKVLNTLIVKNGELSKKQDTPRHHKSRLRLLAAQLILKLCTTPIFDEILAPADFDRLSFVAQDEHMNVRKGFVEKLQKYLVKDKLPDRFYTIIFLTAFEPEQNFKNSIVTWIRSRAKVFFESKTMVLEKTLPRLLSLLAHHPDYSAEAAELIDHARYILYYVSSVASEDNLGLIYKYAQSVKQARDAISPAESENLYVLSDLTQAIISKWEVKKGWTMQSYPAKVRVPAKLFGALQSHSVAQEIAEKNYIPEEMDEELDRLVRNVDKKKSQKRKSMDESSLPAAKKQKSEAKPKSTASRKVAKTPKPRKIKEPKTPTISSADRRKSGRGASARKSYVDRDDDEDEDEMLEGVSKWDYFDEAGNQMESEEEEEEEDEEGDAEDEHDAEEEEPVPKSTGKGKAKAKTPKKSARTVVSEDEAEQEDVDMEDEVEPLEAESPPPQPKRGARAAAKSNAKAKTSKKAAPAPVSEDEIEAEQEQEDVEMEDEVVSSPPKRASRSAKPTPKGKGKKAVREEVEEEVENNTDAEGAAALTELATSQNSPQPTPSPPAKTSSRNARAAGRGRNGKQKKAASPEPEEAEVEEEKEDSPAAHDAEEDGDEEMADDIEPEAEADAEVEEQEPEPEPQTNGKKPRGRLRGHHNTSADVVLVPENEKNFRQALKPTRNTRGKIVRDVVGGEMGVVEVEGEKERKESKERESVAGKGGRGRGKKIKGVVAGGRTTRARAK
ncbi:Sister chromatid cohesion protein pds5 [Ciborinia camelliae]|nr:Sister chromatid cohesion protein pds5 [Ciborinia camelliae]